MLSYLFSFIFFFVIPVSILNNLNEMDIPIVLPSVDIC